MTNQQADDVGVAVPQAYSFVLSLVVNHSRLSLLARAAPARLSGLETPLNPTMVCGRLSVQTTAVWRRVRRCGGAAGAPSGWFERATPR